MRNFAAWLFVGLCMTFVTGVAPATNGIVVSRGPDVSTVLYGSAAYWYWTPIAGLGYLVFSAFVGVILLILRPRR